MSDAAARCPGPTRSGRRAGSGNTAEGVWSLVEREVGNLAAADLAQIMRTVKRRPRQLQYRPEVIDGCLTCTGLVLEN
ncbi:hypothetical protein C3488_27075 [Streptomyces sp. Ru72]|nr:hypothetical protein C3488_27075 [Streptomyces sp. Ru72]